METLWNNVKFALRNLRRSPGFSVVAILTLALGIGANAAIFTVAKSVLLDPLPYSEPEKLVVVLESNPERGLPRFSVSPLNFQDFHASNQTFESLAAVDTESFALTAEGADPERLNVRLVTGEFFQVFGVAPRLGRAIGPEDDKPGAPKVAILGNGLWQRRFGSEEGVLDSTLVLDGEPYTVIGVAAAGFQEHRDIFVPMALDYSQTGRGAHYLNVFGRLKDGVTIERAAEDLAAVAAGLEETYPRSNSGWTTRVESLHELTVGDFDSIVWMLLGAVALVLLIACVLTCLL